VSQGSCVQYAALANAGKSYAYIWLRCGSAVNFRLAFGFQKQCKRQGQPRVRTPFAEARQEDERPGGCRTLLPGRSAGATAHIDVRACDGEDTATRTAAPGAGVFSATDSFR
jgi:hypothetical protein